MSYDALYQGTAVHDAIDRKIAVLLEPDAGYYNPCMVWPRKLSTKVFDDWGYVTTYPRFKKHGDCKMGIPDARSIKVYTCEVRFPKGVLGDTRDDAQFVFACKLMQQVHAQACSTVSAVTRYTTVTPLSDHWRTWAEGHQREVVVQRLFTIEISVDFRDEDKLPVFESIIQQAGQLVYAQSALLGDGVKPNIVMHAHCFFKGHQDIALFADGVAAGVEAVPESSGLGPSAASASAPDKRDESAGFSDELMDALRGNN